MNLTRTFFLCAFLGLGFQALAQQERSWQSESPVDIGTEEVIIVKERENELPPANRPFSQIPPMQIQQEAREFRYDFSDFTLKLPPVRPAIRVRTMKTEEPASPYTRYIKGGFGNYISPYLEAHISSPRASSIQYSLGYVHESALWGPVDKSNSGFADNLLNARSHWIGRSMTLTGLASYERNRLHYYGYNEDQFEPDKSDIKQIYNRFKLGLSAERHATEEFELFAGGVVGRTSSYRGAAESRLNFNGGTRFQLSDMLGLRADVQGMISSYEDSTRITRTVVSARPAFVFVLGFVEIDAGMRFAHENDTAFNAGELHFYPDVMARIRPFESFEAYMGIGGGISPTNYDSLSRLNPYLAERVPLLFTNKTMSLVGGLRGRIGSLFAYGAGFEIASLRNQFYFVRDLSDTTAFTVIYDGESSPYTNAFVELGVGRSEKFHSLLRLDYYQYEPEDVERAWHMPGYGLHWTNTYNIYDKILLRSELDVLGGIEAPGETSDLVRELDPIINLGAEVEYRFSKQGAAFLQLNNVLSKEYERFSGYPSRKILVRIGGAYNF